MTSKAVKALEAVEWSFPVHDRQERRCPLCFEWQSDGKHDDDCLIGQALAEARANPDAGDVSDMAQALRQLLGDAESEYQKTNGRRFAHYTDRGWAGIQLRRLLDSLAPLPSPPPAPDAPRAASPADVQVHETLKSACEYLHSVAELSGSTTAEHHYQALRALLARPEGKAEPTKAETRVSTASPPDENGYRICWFCHCRTNAKVRACCNKGREADTSTPSPAAGSERVRELAEKAAEELMPRQRYWRNEIDAAAAVIARHFAPFSRLEGELADIRRQLGEAKAAKRWAENAYAELKEGASTAMQRREQAERDLSAARAEGEKAQAARPLSEWHEDDGFVLWWKFFVEEPPYVGNPLCDDWPGYHTHWTKIQTPALAAAKGDSAKAAPADGAGRAG